MPAPRRILPLIALAAGALALSACAGATADDSAAPAGGSGTFPVTIPHAFGETVIESQPSRVAAVNWGNHDVPLALGVVPVGFQGGAWGDDDGDGILPWTYAALEGLGATGADLPELFDETDGIDYDSVDAVEPDVILAAYSGVTEEEYNTLLGITSHVVPYPVVAWGTNWRDMALIDGEALGLRAEAESVIADVEAQIDAALAKYPDVAGKTIAYTWIDPNDTSSIWIYTPTDARVQFTEDLGLETSPGILEAVGDSSDFGITIAAENADIIDADILVTYGDGATVEALQADPLLGKIPAVQDGAVVVLADATPLAAATSGPTVLSIPWALDDYLALFQAAAEQVK